MDNLKFVNAVELEELAKQKLDQNAFQYYRSGANEENTLRDNIEAFRRIKLNPRVLRNVSQINLETTVLGHKVYMPIGIAPTAMQKMAAPLGENIPADVAQELNIPYCLSTLSTTGIGEVAESNKNGLRILQLYIQKDRELTKTLIRNAEENGFHALALTVDAPILGKREADERQKFVLPAPLNLQLMQDIAKQQNKVLKNVQSNEGSGLLKFFAQELDQSLNWEDIKWLKTVTNLPIILKGIQGWEDALLAKEYGCQGVWISNHGGRQLDTVRAPVDVLPEITQVLAGSNLEIWVDCGIRRGSDVFKCLALGAKCVFLGRPVLYSLAIGQKAGVERMLKIFETELRMTMQLSGVSRIDQINSSYLVRNTIPKPNL